MAKLKISDFDIDPANNTDINSINIAEGCAPSGINNAIRQLMADLKEFQTGAGGDSFNGAVNGTLGATTPSSAVVTTLQANTSVSTDTIAEKTSAAGVTVDGVLLKDNAVSASSGFTQNNTFNSASTFGFKNRLINSDMRIDQRNAGASVTPTSAGQYSLDRWKVTLSQSSKFSVQQNAGSVTPPNGFKNYLGVTSLSSYSIGAGDFFALIQSIEGYNIADLGWGTAGASPVTLSFWVRSSLTGTFGGVIDNSAADRSYPFSYTISSANTWTQISITIAGDTTGTWAANNTAGLAVWFGLGIGSTYSGTAGAWSGSTYFSATGATSVVGTNGATFYITGVQLEKGSTATSFDYRPYGTELALCQRYYWKIDGSSNYFSVGVGYATSGTAGRFNVNFPTTMRASPTISYGGSVAIGAATSSPAITSGTTFYGGVQQGMLDFVASGGGLVARECFVVYCTSGSSANYFSASSEL